MRDADHEITILTGVISAQGRDIKEMKNRLESFDQRFTSLEERFDQRFTSSEEKFDQRFASLEGKLEQVVQLLTTPPRQTNNLPALKASMLFLTSSVSLKLQKAGR